MIDIKDYEGKYYILNNGNIFNYPNATRKKSKQLKPFKLKSGYLVIELCKNGKRKKHLIHRLVAAAYLCNFENKTEVNHINGIKNDNRVENLEWCTRSENQKHAIKLGLRSAKGIKNSQSKLTELDVLQIRKLYKKEPLKKIAEMFNISISNVCSIGKKNTWEHVK